VTGEYRCAASEANERTIPMFRFERRRGCGLDGLRERLRSLERSFRTGPRALVGNRCFPAGLRGAGPAAAGLLGPATGHLLALANRQDDRKTGCLRDDPKAQDAQCDPPQAAFAE
jgi:hypothetical protein